MSRNGLPEPISRLIDELAKLPGIGEKNATRLAFHIFRSSQEYSNRLSQVILDAKTKVITCNRCFHFSSKDPCEICISPNRDKSTICVVEEPLDLLAIEKSKEFKGLYHVLHGVISPLDGIGPEDLKIQPLIQKIKDEQIMEVVMATNPNVEGDATAMYLAKLIKPFDIKVTRLAHGIPVGGDLEYIDELTLSKALRDRIEI